MELIELSMRILSFSFLLTVTGVSNSSLLLLGKKGDGEGYKRGRGRERERVTREGEGERGRGLKERRESKARSNLIQRKFGEMQCERRNSGVATTCHTQVSVEQSCYNHSPLFRCSSIIRYPFIKENYT